MAQSLRILQINSGMGWSGSHHHEYLLSCGLAERGHEVTLACNTGSALEEKAKAAGLTVYPIQMRGQWDLGAILALRNLLKKERFHVINTHKPLAHTLILLASVGLDIPIIATRHVSFRLRRHPLRRLKWVWAVTGWIAASEAVKQSLIASGIPKERITVIYAGVDLERFHSRVQGDRIRTEFHIEPEALVVGQVGDLRPWKGYADFIRAARLILDEMPMTRFLAVGRKGEEYRSLQKLAGALGISESIYFTGFRSDIEECYAAMNVCVSASTAGEAAPYALKEPLAMGIPVVATRAGGSHEVVIDGETGIQVPPCDPKALAEAILRLLKDPDLRKGLGQNGRQSIEKRFSINEVITQTEVVYQEAVTHRR